MPITDIRVQNVPRFPFPYTRKAQTETKKSITESQVDLNTDPRAMIGRSLIGIQTVQMPREIQATKDPNTIPQKKLAQTLEKIIENDKKSENPVIKSVHSNFISQFTQKVCDNPKKNIIIGISGESASGKSTITKAIKDTADDLGVDIEVISADNYFKDISKLIQKHGSFEGVIASGYDPDSPDNFYLQQLHDDIEELANGNDVKIPQYLINGTGKSVPNAIPKKAEKVIIVEGMAVMHDPVKKVLDAEIYVDIDPETQEERLIRRAPERGQTVEDAIKQLAYVREAAAKYILPQKDNADIIIDGGVDIENHKQIIEGLFKALSRK